MLRVLLFSFASFVFVVWADQKVSYDGYSGKEFSQFKVHISRFRKIILKIFSI